MRGVASTMIAFGLGACASPAVTPPSDGMGSGAGLTVPWTASPAVPGPVSSNVSITSMVFRVDSLRVVGDTGTSDTLDGLELQWGPGQAPSPAVFSNAPSGLYSKVAFHADGAQVNFSWEIDGSVQLEDGSHAFVVHDLMPLSAEIDESASLEPGGSAELGVTFHVDQPFAGVDFQALALAGDLLVLDTDDAQMPNFRTQLQQAIGGSPSVN